MLQNDLFSLDPAFYYVRIRISNTACIDPLEKPLPVNFRKNQDEIFSKLLVSWQQNIYLHWLTLGEYGTLVPYICKSTGTCASFNMVLPVISGIRKKVVDPGRTFLCKGSGQIGNFRFRGTGIKVTGPGKEWTGWGEQICIWQIYVYNCFTFFWTLYTSLWGTHLPRKALKYWCIPTKYT